MKNSKKEVVDIMPLVEVMEILRGPHGCQWDKKQTHASLRRYLLEETAEVLEAIDNKDMPALCDELGDLLLQIVFHARVAEEQGIFTLQDVIQSITEKMIRRHPHVFSDTKVTDVEEIRTNWDAIKAKEKSHKGRRIMDGIPKELPTLLKAQKIQEKASKVGFVWPTVDGVWEKLYEEISEFKVAIDEKNEENMEKEAGDILFSLINLLEWYKISGENALRRTNMKFLKRFSYVENSVETSNRDWTSYSLEELDNLWESAKKQEKD